MINSYVTFIFILVDVISSAPNTKLLYPNNDPLNLNYQFPTNGSVPNSLSALLSMLDAAATQMEQRLPPRHPVRIPPAIAAFGAVPSQAAASWIPFRASPSNDFP